MCQPHTYIFQAHSVCLNHMAAAWASNAGVWEEFCLAAFSRCTGGVCGRCGQTPIFYHRHIDEIFRQQKLRPAILSQSERMVTLSQLKIWRHKPLVSIGHHVSVAELLQAMGRGISSDGCVSTRVVQCSDDMSSQLFLEISESFVLCWGPEPGFLCTQQLSQWFG